MQKNGRLPIDSWLAVVATHCRALATSHCAPFWRRVLLVGWRILSQRGRAAQGHQCLRKSRWEEDSDEWSSSTDSERINFGEAKRLCGRGIRRRGARQARCCANTFPGQAAAARL